MPALFRRRYADDELHASMVSLKLGELMRIVLGPQREAVLFASLGGLLKALRLEIRLS